MSPADKVSNNIVFVCKAHYTNCILEELRGFNSAFGNTNDSHSPLFKEENLQNHMSVLNDFNIHFMNHFPG